MSTVRHRCPWAGISVAVSVRWAPVIQRERAEAQAVIKLTAGRWWASALHHSPNEELSSVGRQLAASQGTKKGFPDWCLFIRSGNYAGLALELKAAAPHGQAATKEQQAWLTHLREQGWFAIVCYGAEDAIKALDDYIARGSGGPWITLIDQD